jgi:hypothetical protein
MYLVFIFGRELNTGNNNDDVSFPGYRRFVCGADAQRPQVIAHHRNDQKSKGDAMTRVGV